MKRKVYKNIDETVYTVTLKNKMKVYLLYKPGFVEKHAYVVTEFGHFDSVRKIQVNGEKIPIPWGAAHFLEHRMFSLGEIDASDLFADLGATCNAYTTYEKTTYYFSTQKNFYECLSILLKMMSSFTSTPEQIENEKSIILQEASMYDEDPNHVLNSAILKQAYHNHPINVDVIGTKETIKNMSYDVLKAIYDTFYDPSNLSLVVCGDINPNELEEYLNENLLESKNISKITPLKITEPLEVVDEEGVAKLPTIEVPRFAYLYKFEGLKKSSEKDKMYFSYYFLLEHLFASSGVLSEKWLNEGIITSLMDYSIISNIDLDCLIFYNISDDVDLIIKSLNDVFDINKKVPMTQEDLDKIRKTHYGQTIRAYESVGGLCSYFVYDLFTSFNDFFAEVEEVSKITLEDIEKAYYNICKARTTLAVLRGD